MAEVVAGASKKFIAVVSGEFASLCKSALVLWVLLPAESPTSIAVVSRIMRQPKIVLPCVQAADKFTKISIFDVAAVGVIATEIPVISVKTPVVELEKVSVFAVDTTCNTFPPPAGATHFKPVASTLSATMLQLGKGIILSLAQSCANVLDKRIIPILNCELWN
jgi:hypothetical protein